MYGIKAIIGKELLRVFKDKKLVISLFVLPVAMVIGLFALMGTLITNMQSDIEAHKSCVTIVNAPATYREMIDYVVSNGDIAAEVTYLSTSEYTEAVEKEKKDGIYGETVDLLMVFPKDFDEEGIVAGATESSQVLPDVKTYYNASADYSSEAKGVFVEGLLEQYRVTLQTMKYGSMNEVYLFTVDADNDEVVIQNDDKAVGKLLGMMLPYFITMLIFANAMGLGVDMITGEKERGTLASMLLSPVSRTQIVLGKLFSLAILAVMSAAVYIITMVVAMPSLFSGMGADELSGIQINFSTAQIIELVILMIGVVLLYVSVIGMVSVFGKTIKDASSLITPVYLLVIVAGFITMYSNGASDTVMYLIPVYGSSMALRDIFTQEITIINFLASLASTYVATAVMVFIMTKAFKSEKVMFNA